MATKIKGANIRETLVEALWRVLETTTPDAERGIQSSLFDVTLLSDTCEYELDVGREIWFTKSRWTRLLNDYVDPVELRPFVKLAKHIHSGEAAADNTCNMRFKIPVRGHKVHEWGGCLMAAAFRPAYKRRKSEIIFFSRASYVGYVGMLDAAIARALAAEIAAPGQISFRWHIASMQVHCFKILGFVLSDPKLQARLKHLEKKPKLLKKASRIWQAIARQHRVNMKEAWKKHGLAMIERENCKYGPLRRIRKRWLQMQGHLDPLPTVPIETLTLKKKLSEGL
jgi:hypothetical protein